MPRNNNTAARSTAHLLCIMALLLYIFMFALLVNASVASDISEDGRLLLLQPVRQEPAAHYKRSDHSFISGRVYVEQMIGHLQPDCDTQQHAQVDPVLCLEANDASYSERLSFGYFEPLPFGPDSLRLKIVNGVLFAEQRLSMSNDDNRSSMFATNFEHFSTGRIVINDRPFNAMREHDELIVYINLSPPSPTSCGLFATRSRHSLNARSIPRTPFLVPDGRGSYILVCELRHKKDRVGIIRESSDPISMIVLYSASKIQIESSKALNEALWPKVSDIPIVLFNFGLSLTTIMLLPDFQTTVLNSCTLYKLNVATAHHASKFSKIICVECIGYLEGQMILGSELIDFDRRRCEEKRDRDLEVKKMKEKGPKPKRAKPEKKKRPRTQQPILPKPSSYIIWPPENNHFQENPTKRPRTEDEISTRDIVEKVCCLFEHYPHIAESYFSTEKYSDDSDEQSSTASHTQAKN